MKVGTDEFVRRGISSVIEAGWHIWGRVRRRKNSGQKLGIHHGSITEVGSDLRVLTTSEPTRATTNQTVNDALLRGGLTLTIEGYQKA